MRSTNWLWLGLLFPTSNALAQTPPELAVVPVTEVVGPTFHFGDFDADGLADIYVVEPAGTDQLFRNLGTGVFEDVTLVQGLSGNEGSVTALWFDFDGDKALDLYVSKVDGRSRLLQNTGQGVFVDVTAVSAIEHRGAELFAQVVDYDADSAPDLLVATELGDILWHNLGRGRFERAALPSLGGASFSVDVTEHTDASAIPTGEAVSEDETLTALRNVRRARASRIPSITLNAANNGNNNTNGGGPSFLITCRPDIMDSVSGVCLGASTTPTLGMLYPLNTNLFVSPTGTVGMGTTTPDSRAHIVSASAGTVSAGPGTVLTIENNANSYVSLLSPDANERGVIFGEPSNNVAGGIIYNSASVQDGLDLRTNGNVNRMAITGTGSVGIGTTAPDDKLDVNGSIGVDNGNLNTGTISNALRFGAGATSEGIGSKRSVGGNVGGLDFYTAGVNRIAITNGGLVGIGTSSPGQELDVTGEVRASGQLMSTVATGTSPLSVSSTTKVTNLNVDQLDGIDSTSFSQFGSSVDTSEITDATITGADIASGTITGTNIMNNTVDSLDINDGSLTGVDIFDGTIGTNDIADGSIFSADIGIGQVNGNHISNGSIGMVDIGQNGAGSGHVIKWNGSAWAPAADELGLASQWSNNGSAIYYNGGYIGVGTTNPESRLHVQANSAGTVTANGFSVLVAENNAPCFVSLLTPDASERGILFGEASNNAAGGIVYNNSSTPDGLQLRTNGNTTRMVIDGAGFVGIGTTSPIERLDVAGATRTQCVKITGGCDLAEPFEFVAAGAQPGMVVAIDPEQEGKLRVANTPYDTTAVGVVSGAGGVKTGMTMSQESVLDTGELVALTGRVYCWCDAATGAIRPGDLLTTSATAGHAMKAADRMLATGAIVGKALTSLAEGRGLVLIVVTLQ